MKEISNFYVVVLEINYDKKYISTLLIPEENVDAQLIGLTLTPRINIIHFIKGTIRHTIWKSKNPNLYSKLIKEMNTHNYTKVDLTNYKNKTGAFIKNSIIKGFSLNKSIN